MCLFYKYRNLGGIPGQGIHKARIFGLARNDLLATILFAAFLSLAVSNIYSVYFIKLFTIITTLLIVLGFVMHILFCVKTPLTSPFLK